MAKQTGPKKIWDNCKLIGEVLKSPSSKLKIELVARDGVKYINIREWYMKKSEGVWKPGLAGFAVPVQLPIEGQTVEPILDLCSLISRGIAEATDFPLEDEANAVYAKE